MRRNHRTIAGVALGLAALASPALLPAGAGASSTDVVAAEVERSWAPPGERLRLTPDTDGGTPPTPTPVQVAGGLLLAAGAAELAMARRDGRVSLDLSR